MITINLPNGLVSNTPTINGTSITYETLLTPTVVGGDVTITIDGTVSVAANTPTVAADGSVSLQLTESESVGGAIVTFADPDGDWRTVEVYVSPFANDGSISQDMATQILSELRCIPRAKQEIPAGEHRRRITKKHDEGDINEVFSSTP